MSRRADGGPTARFICPACRTDVERLDSACRCASCSRTYPILFGIPDFRIDSDRYLTLQQERDKAERLDRFARDATFDELLAFYYEITDDVPPELARRYMAGVRSAQSNAKLVLDQLPAHSGAGRLLDAGCGAGGHLLAAAPRYEERVGVDIALRWLVICKKRLEEAGVEAELVCADAHMLPFPERQFDHVLAVDLIEHARSPPLVMRELARQLTPLGTLWMSAGNRYSLGPHPSTRVWAVGYLPRRIRSAILRRLRGVDSLRFVHFVSPWGIRRMGREGGLTVVRQLPRGVGSTAGHGYPLIDRILIAIYRFALRLGPLRTILLAIGPAFETTFTKRTSDAEGA